MTKKKSNISAIAMAIIVAIAVCIGAAVFCSYIEAKKHSYTAMLLEQAEVIDEIVGSGETVTVEYGADTVDLWTDVFAEKKAHPNMYIDYTVDGETELAAFSTKAVGEHVIVYTFKSEDDYGQAVSDTRTVVYVVEDTQAPVITLADTEVTVYEGDDYDVNELIESVTDVVDGDLEPTIETDYTKDSPAGEYEVKITATDCNGLTSVAAATVKVIEKPVKIVEASTTPVQSTPSYASYDASRIYVGNYTAIIYFTAEDQAQVDAPDSAICYTQGGKTVVADHAYQGFNAILSNNTGMLLGQRIHKVSTHNGTVADDRKDVYFDDGGSFLANYDGPIVMYTCIEGENRVAVTYWDYD